MDQHPPGDGAPHIGVESDPAGRAGRRSGTAAPCAGSNPRISDPFLHKHDLAVDRTRCSWFLANQFRLLLTLAAYVLLQSVAEVTRDRDLLKTQNGHPAPALVDPRRPGEFLGAASEPAVHLAPSLGRSVARLCPQRGRYTGVTARDILLHPAAFIRRNTGLS